MCRRAGPSLKTHSGPCAHGTPATPPCPPAAQILQSAGAADPPRARCRVSTSAGRPCRVLTPSCTAALACRVLPRNSTASVGPPPHPGLREARWVLEGPTPALCTLLLPMSGTLEKAPDLCQPDLVATLLPRGSASVCLLRGAPLPSRGH